MKIILVGWSFDQPILFKESGNSISKSRSKEYEQLKQKYKKYIHNKLRADESYPQENDDFE